MIKGEIIPFHGELVDRDAIDIGELYAKAKTSLVDSVKYQIECGQRLVAKKASKNHGEWLPWLKENEAVLGFSTRVTAERLMKLALSKCIVNDAFDEAEAARISRETWKNAGSSQLIQQSISNEHYTPAQYIEAARTVLGWIDLDPASCKEANDIVKANRILTQDADGLEGEWDGRVWLNPPYGRQAGDFIIKLVDEYQSGRVQAGIALVNAHCTDTSWFQPLWNGVLCFTDHRINFYGDDERSGSTHGSVFAYFGDNPELFADQFKQFGAIVHRFDR